MTGSSAHSPLPPRAMTPQQWQATIAQYQLVYGEPQRPGIMETPDGEIAKFFYARKKITSARVWPPAQRFAKNSRLLAGRGIDAPVVTDISYCTEKQAWMVLYPRLPGSTIREEPKHLPFLANFLAELHQKGIYFRAIHLGNIITRQNNSMALIDIADLRCRARTLGPFLRARNFAHLSRSEEDLDHFQNLDLKSWLDSYRETAKLERIQWQQFKFYLSHLDGKLFLS